jgi:CheY-like chemotaxis protein
MDVQMPAMDGLSHGSHPQNESAPVCICPSRMTAYAMTGDRERCIAAGMDGYITKPINTLALLDLVAKYGRKRLPVPSVGVELSDPSEVR